MAELLLTAIFVGFICGLIAGPIAASKGRSGFGWFLLGILVGPLAILGAAIVSTETPLATNTARALELEAAAWGVDPIPAPEIPADPGIANLQTREVLASLRELASLKQSGFLSDEEVAAAKKDLLARI